MPAIAAAASPQGPPPALPGAAAPTAVAAGDVLAAFAQALDQVAGAAGGQAGVPGVTAAPAGAAPPAAPDTPLAGVAGPQPIKVAVAKSAAAAVGTRPTLHLVQAAGNLLDPTLALPGGDVATGETSAEPHGSANGPATEGDEGAPPSETDAANAAAGVVAPILPTVALVVPAAATPPLAAAVGSAPIPTGAAQPHTLTGRVAEEPAVAPAPDDAAPRAAAAAQTLDRLLPASGGNADLPASVSSAFAEAIGAASPRSVLAATPRSAGSARAAPTESTTASVGASAALTTAQAEAPLATAAPGAEAGGGGDANGSDDPQARTAPPPGASASPDTPAAAFTPAAAATSSTAVPTRETVTGLTAEIVRHAGKRSSRFEVALNPEGLGRVDVRLEIGADGRLSAHLAFDSADSAAALGARAGELRQALAQAGFDVPPQSLSFEAAPGGLGGGDFSGFGSRQQQGGAQTGSAATRAFLAADADVQSAAAAPPTRSSAAARGLDIRI